nr:hypothetical protein OG409_36070 [Streptomyces sp. NBC_00974]
MLPFCAVSTLGTTATGAIDPLEPLSAVYGDLGMRQPAETGQNG